MCAVVIGVRVVWMGLALARIRAGRRAPTERAVPSTPGEALVLAWAGMRGLATLALALAIPTTLDSGAPFPDRAELVIVACSVLVVTLVGPGVTLPVLVRVLGLREDADTAAEAERAIAARARRAALDELRARFTRMGAALSGDDVPRPQDTDDDPDDDYRERLARLKRRREQWGRVQAVALAAARREVVAARGEPGTDPEAADRVLRRLDVRSLARGL